MAGARALLPLLLIGGGVAAALAASKAKADEPEPDGGVRVPGRPVIQGGTIVLRGYKSNAGGVRVTFQVEQVAGDPSPKGEFFGVIFRPWESNTPAMVAQATTRDAARDQTIAHIAGDPHGAPG
jgi:hypothetical protein